MIAGRPTLIFFLSLLLLLSGISAACTSSDPQGNSSPSLDVTLKPEPTPTLTIAEMIASVSDGVVRIRTARSHGAGIVVRSGGIILTSNDVVADAGTELNDLVPWVEVVTSGGRQLKGFVVCNDSVTNLALVHVENMVLPEVLLGDSSALALGTKVTKVGYSSALPGTVSIATGIVSAIGSDRVGGPILIETDMPSTPSDKGGPLLDRSGRVIGVSLNLSSSQGNAESGLAVSIDEAKQSLLKLHDDGTGCIMPPRGFQLTTVTDMSGAPDVSGRTVVWLSHFPLRFEISGYDLETTQKFRIASWSGTATDPRINENIVVWTDLRNGNPDIYGYDLEVKREFQITTDPASQMLPEVSGDVVVWQDERNGNLDIYGFNLKTQTEFQITTDNADQQQARISGDTVIWEDRRDSKYDPRLCPGAACPGSRYATYGYDLTNNAEFQLPFRVWAIDGELASGTQDTPMGDRISVYNIETRERVASWLVPKDAIGIQISGDIVVWSDNRSDRFDAVYAYDLRTNTEFLVAKGNIISEPAFDGSLVVWSERGRSGKSDIYGGRIDGIR